MKYKKILSALYTSFFVFSMLCANVSALNTGDIIDKVLSTDIVTYIDSVRVPSFNIQGRTAVLAENLNACKLDYSVIYDDALRTLSIYPHSAQGSVRDTFYFDTDTSSKPVGTPIMNVLFTDINAYVNGTEIESFNIGGYTCIFADDLAKLCGEYEWDESARTVNVRTFGKQKLPSAVKIPSTRMLTADDSVITKSETFNRWASPAKSHIATSENGEYVTVEISEHVNIETYDSDFNLINSFAIKKELPLFGGLYFGKEFNYIAFGQKNLLCDNSAEVIKIVIYDKNFVKISEIPVSNCKTTIPFDASNSEMFENDRYLVLHTARTQYPDENGNAPQTQLTVIVDKHTWQIVNMLGKYQYNHTSHALSQFVRIDEDKIITANYSDAAPVRGAFLQQLDFNGKVINTQSIFNTGGLAGANCTGAMIGGFEISDSGYLVTISTIDHSLPTGYSNINIDGIDRENRDIYLLWADKHTLELKHTCLAGYTATGLTGSSPYIVKLRSGTFMVLWQQFSDFSEESNTVCFAFIDKDGNQMGSTHSVTAQLSDSCAPIENNGKVVWYLNTADGRVFYSIDANSDAYSEIAQDGDLTGDSAMVTPQSPDTDQGNTVPEQPVTPETDAPESREENPDTEKKSDSNKKDPVIVDGI